MVASRARSSGAKRSPSTSDSPHSAPPPCGKRAPQSSVVLTSSAPESLHSPASGWGLLGERPRSPNARRFSPFAAAEPSKERSDESRRSEAQAEPPSQTRLHEAQAEPPSQTRLREAQAEPRDKSN